ncbi:hypothetical protein BYT27DRAFT_7084235 [Phlegmacium glaucopus]|nr:hypothetical protein BYT27DRAFT_7084235 [Phlegmacium glaucopus]
MTPFEAAFGKKPNLKGLREWGEKVYVRTEGGTKLGGRVKEGRWLGIDDESKGVRIYWPDTKTVTVERNVTYDNSSANRFEEEDVTLANIKTIADLPVEDVPKNPPNEAATNPLVDENPEIPSDTELPNKRIRKPTQKVAELLGRQGTWSGNGKGTVLAPGIQQPTENWTASMEECEDKHAFVAEVSNAEALEPKNL